MGEVGTNSSDNSHADLKMNGGINGNCEDDTEAMDVDAQNPTVTKNADSCEQLPADKEDSNNVVESDIGGNLGDELITGDTINENVKENNSAELKAHENGTEEKCDVVDDDEPMEETSPDDSIEKNAIEEVNESSMKIDEDNDPLVTVSKDPLSADAEPIEDDKRTNQSQSESTENGTSATITSSNDKNGKL